MAYKNYGTWPALVRDEMHPSLKVMVQVYENRGFSS